MSLTDTINLGLNNSDCGFFVGYFTGNMNSIELLITIGILWYVFKAIDKLAFDPLMKKVKKMWRSRK